MIDLEEYEKIAFKGEGGFTQIFKIRHKKLHHIRAVRELKQFVGSHDDKIYKSFVRECKNLLLIGNGNHPNIIRIYEPQLSNNRAFVGMDYVDGYNLREYLEAQNNFIPIDEIIRFVCDISSALAYCHEDVYELCMDKELDKLREDTNDGSKILLSDDEREALIKKYSIVHNDIHDGNVMRKHYSGSYILLDFGLAVSGDEVVTSSRIEHGRPIYFAPERFRLQDNPDKRPTTQMDIYSFGILMYQMLAGRVPFMYNKDDVEHSSDVLEVAQYMRKHEKMKVPDIYPLRKAAYESINQDGEYTKDYPEWLEDTILKCLVKKPEDRFANGKALHIYVMEHIEMNKKKEKEDLENKINILVNKNAQQSEHTTSLINKLKEEKEQLESELKKLASVKNEQSEPENNIINANTVVDESVKLSSQSKPKETKIRNKKITFYFLISILLVFAYYIISSFLFSKEDKNQLEVSASEQSKPKNTVINVVSKEVISEDLTEKKISTSEQIKPKDTVTNIAHNEVFSEDLTRKEAVLVKENSNQLEAKDSFHKEIKLFSEFKKNKPLSISTSLAPSTLSSVIIPLNKGCELYINDLNQVFDSTELYYVHLHAKYLFDLPPGTYIFEYRKKFHRSRKRTIILKAGQGQLLGLPAPIPIYGTLMVETNVMDHVYLNGKYIGFSPLYKEDLLIGPYNLEVMRNGNIIHKDKITIEEESTVVFISKNTNTIDPIVIVHNVANSKNRKYSTLDVSLKRSLGVNYSKTVKKVKITGTLNNEDFKHLKTFEEIDLEDADIIGDIATIYGQYDKVNSIPSTAFTAGSFFHRRNKTLKNIVLPKSSNEILVETFKNCTSLQSITLPESITKIGHSAFHNCTSLTKIEVNWTAKIPVYLSIDENDFKNVDIKNVTLLIPKGTKEMYKKNTFFNKFNLKEK